VEASDVEHIREDAPRVRTPGSRPRARGHVRAVRQLPLAPSPIREGRPSRQILGREAYYRRFLALSDMVATCAAIFAAAALTGQRASVAAVVGAPVVVLLAKMAGLYDRDELLVRKTTLEEAPSLFQVATVFTLAAWIVQAALDPNAFSPAEAGVLWPLLFTLLLSVRAVARRAARRVLDPERCLVVGTRGAAERLSKTFARGSTVNAEVVGRIPIQYGRRDGEDRVGAVAPSTVPLLGDLDALSGVLRAHAVDRVLVAPGGGLTDELLEVIKAVKAFGVRVSVVPRLFEVVGSSAVYDDVGGTTLLGIRRYGLSRSSWRLKRALDLVLTTVLLTCLSPVFVLIAIAIKLDSRGPVLFRQRRIGQEGLEFEMVKFRTMSEDAERKKRELVPLNEAEGLFKIADDPRITRVGKILRKSSLDELPQLLNVLYGQMSLVGPRPLVPDDDERVQGLDRRRLHVPPGMTGHWQILGSSRVPLGEMVKIDYLYGANWSLWGDLKILLRTVPYVAARRGQ
jgi:exopolysaccharide biosynthesis polyprenyl glycosylphosphotransferase